jgi:thermitase
MKRQQSFLAASRQIFPTLGRDARAAWLSAILTFLVAVALCLATGNAHGQQPPSKGNGKPFAAGRILVDPQPGTSDAQFAAVLAAHGGRSMGRLYGMTVHAVQVPGGAEQSIAAALARHPNVRFAEVDQLMPPAGFTDNDPYLSSQWHLPKINAPTAWNTTTGVGVTIAILDTGVNGTHPDLSAQMVPGYNFYNNSTNTSDANGHGTAVAGAAAATLNNGIGVASVAGGARIMPVTVADPSGYAYWSTAAQGITWAADHGARIANLSYLGASASSTIISAAQYLISKGGMLFVSAGNNGAVDNTPATPYIVVVSATDQNDQFCTWSSYGSFVDVSAPGYYIYTTYYTGGYANYWGTSFSSPIAGAVGALMFAANPTLSPTKMVSLLESSAHDLGTTGYDVKYGYGRVDAAAAVQAALNAGNTSDTTPPSVAIASPTGGTVSGTVTVSANASDNVGVARVELRVNGTSVATDSASPYQFAWDSTKVANGAVTLTAAAYDAAGNSSVSSPVSLNVSNTTNDTTPPTVSITSPSSGTTVSGTVTVSANASDNVGVTRVDFRVNGATVATSNVSPYKFTWDSTTVANGTVTLTTAAYDAAGNSAVSSPVSVNVSNSPSTPTSDTTPPTVAINSPANGSSIGGNVSITASASDNSGAAGITQKLYIDGALKATATGSSLSYRWAAQKVAKGSHTIKVTATDKANNSASAQITVTR